MAGFCRLLRGVMVGIQGGGVEMVVMSGDCGYCGGWGTRGLEGWGV